MRTKEQYEELLKHAYTDVQRENIKAVLEHGSCGKAGKALKKHRRTVEASIKGLEKQLAKKNKISSIGAEGYSVKGESVLVDGQGRVKQKWIKTYRDADDVTDLIQAIKDTFDEYDGKSLKPGQGNRLYNNDLLAVIPIGDGHLGMLAWAEETGQDFDLSIGERDLLVGVERIIEAAPNAKTCLIAEMGDFVHRDDDSNRTQSGHELDCDGRHQKMLRVCVKVLVHAVNQALKKFETVIVRNVLGNHGPRSEQALAMALEIWYRNNDRVKIETSVNKFWYYQHGQCLIGTHHGDKIKHSNLPLIMASDVPEMWGATKHRYFYIGHIHHETVKEHPGCIIESFNTLAGRDAWHHASGYRARQNIKLIILHKKYGEIERVIKDISMLRDNG